MKTSPLTYVLIVGYPVAWVLSAHNPLSGLALLLLLSLPVSIYQLVVGLVMGNLITVLLAVLCIVFPFLAPFIILYPLIRMFVRVASNLAPAAATIVLYSVVVAAPSALRSNVLLTIVPESSAYSELFNGTILFTCGALLVLATLKLLDSAGYSNDRAAQSILGFPGFLVSILLFFINFDGDGDLGPDHRHD